MNLNVFKFMIDIIDTCAERGAFRGDELQNVGSVRTLLSDFIAQNEPPEEQLLEDTEETETPN